MFKKLLAATPFVLCLALSPASPAQAQDAATVKQFTFRLAGVDAYPYA
jgi:hypothetical protein